MDASQWTQGSFPGDIKPHMGSSRQQAPLHQREQQQERKTVQPHKDQALNCPRCNSANTKFCYYNNYSASQPRYFCKACRRYWTEGGSLRNVPVGGGSRKNKRSSSSASASTSGSKTKLPLEHHHQQDQDQNPRIIHQGQDLNLAFPPPSDHDQDENPKSPSIDLLKGNSGISSMVLSLGSFMPPLPILETSTSYSAGFPLMEFRPSLGFPNSDGFENSYGSLQGLQESSSTGAKLFFPVEDLKQVPGPSPSSSTNHHHHHHQFDHNRPQGDPSGYWNGVLGGGSW
ncbi:hypothetical protein MLD38_019873 [Melastoma candidum]|uniref:Uncharacterized protein n=2 Tax=Melastoma candidum TaxID=119954 RepID=A0ACB9QBG0_9MYRT|nr:hypothetical protein MLD38_019873 [Melastoma candidum]